MFDLTKFWSDFNEFTKPESLDEFLAAGGDINFIHPDSGWSLLNLAIEHMNRDFIKALVEKGINLDAPSTNLPLFHAVDIDIDSAVQQNREIIFSNTRLVIELGADLEKKDMNNKSIYDMLSIYDDIVGRKFEREIAQR
ncbi:ankyrin repeat domain-containing protein [Methylosinus sp. Sm6]|uniref:ankyrin repeat domain-containing protein n=1 Tax=Methylosinus sp. Sm6 TaxID=2866948 RepID=UPI001C992ED9|nr:ankyrin repeat domain-containing protein [Methylosinus sp. Sm6]MBY6243231.1 ankyrin repeat domain-containing protein [Methylosinus sp. Sm6]